VDRSYEIFDMLVREMAEGWRFGMVFRSYAAFLAFFVGFVVMTLISHRVIFQAHALIYSVSLWCHRQMRTYFSEYIPHKDDGYPIPKGTSSLIGFPEGNIRLVVYDDQGHPLVYLPYTGLKSSLTAGSLGQSLVQEMAAPGALPHEVPPTVNETRYSVIFLDGFGNKVGVGFAIMVKSKPVIVTANHVYGASTHMRGAHSNELMAIPAEGKTLSDVRFIHLETDTCSRMSLRVRRPPTKVHRGSGKIAVLRKTAQDAPTVIERMYTLDSKIPFSFTHVSNTMPGDSGSPLLVGAARSPVAVHIGSDHSQGKNLAVALQPLIRLLYHATDSVRVDESDDRYESLFTEQPYEAFVSDWELKGVKPRNTKFQTFRIDDERVGYLDSTGAFTHAWADYDSDEEYDISDFPALHREEKAQFHDTNTIPDVVGPKLPASDPLLFGQAYPPGYKPLRFTEWEKYVGDYVEENSPAPEPYFRSRLLTPPSTAVQRRGMMPDPIPRRETFNGRLPVRPFSVSRYAGHPVSDTTVAQVRREAKSPKKSSSSSQSSPHTVTPPQAVRVLQRPFNSPSEATLRLAHLTRGHPVVKSISGVSTLPTVSEAPPTKSSRRRRKKQLRRSSSPATRVTPSTSTRPQMDKRSKPTMTPSSKQ
jgi:hypothetical protein